MMPQNIVVGDDAEKVAQFIDHYSGTQVEDSPRALARVRRLAIPGRGSGGGSATSGGSGSGDQS